MKLQRNLVMGLVVGAATLLATTALAAAPSTTLIEGVLTSSGGSPAADGLYDITFTIYDAKVDGKALWSEGPDKVAAQGGRFSHALGATKAIDAGALAAAQGLWLALKIGSDPELPRQALHATVFALSANVAGKLDCDGCVSGDQIANGSVASAKLGFNYAASATKGGPALDLSCTGCVSVAEMKFDGDVDLGGNALKAGDITGKTITATAFVGDGSKLTGLKTPAGECKNAGEVVKGINADGSLKCVAALDPSALPKDGLNEISNDLISNQFVDTINGAEGVAIPDNTGGEANSVLDFPDIGTSQTFAVTVEVSNSDLSSLALTILPPDDKKTGWTLCDPCGKADEKSYNATFDKDNLPKSGDLAKWIGANPKGTWNLKALDSNFCIIQKPGNDKICNLSNKTDGSIVKWSIKIQTLSNKKIAINGDSYQAGTAHFKDINVAGLATLGNAKIGSANDTCEAGRTGTLRWAGKGMEVCVKSHKNDNKSFTYQWTHFSGVPAMWSGGCKSHSTGGGWDRYCSNGVDFNTASSYFTTSGDGRFTFKISGYYRVNVWADGYDSSYRRCALRKNGSDFAYTHEYDGHNGWQQCGLNQVWPFKEGDYVEAWFQTNNGHYRWHSWNAAGQHSRMQIEYVGALDQ